MDLPSHEFPRMDHELYKINVNVNGQKRIASFDVGIKNLALCVFDVSGKSISIAYWDVINLIQNETLIHNHQCNCSSFTRKKENLPANVANGPNIEKQNVFIVKPTQKCAII